MEQLKQIQSIQLEKAYTFFMVPFYYDEAKCPIANNELWELEKEKVSNEGEEGDILFPYIMNFLQGQVTQAGIKGEYLTIYRLKIDEKSPRQTTFWKPFTNNFSVLRLKEKESGIKFKILAGTNHGFSSPHIFISESAQIGILCFCVEIAEKQKTMSDLKLLNYYLHKLHNPLAECVFSALKMNEKMVFQGDESQQLMQKAQKEESLRKAREYMQPGITHDPYSDFIWNIRELIDMWLGKNAGIKLFSQTRAHLFTYCQIDDSKEETITFEMVLPDLLRLSRCVNDKYQLDIQNELDEGCCLRTFSNVYVSSSVEGTTILAVAKKSNSGFIKNMDGSVRLRYLWVYLLSMIQRYSMHNLNRKLAERESRLTDRELKSLFDVIQKVKIHCYYTDVSPYSQHNRFYQHCCKCLHVEESYHEIERKAEILTQTISKRAEEKAETKQRHLNVVVSILTIFQVGAAIFTFTNREASDNISIPVGSMLLSVLIICVVFYKDIIRFITAIFSSNNQ